MGPIHLAANEFAYSDNGHNLFVLFSLIFSSDTSKQVGLLTVLYMSVYVVRYFITYLRLQIHKNKKIALENRNCNKKFLFVLCS